MNPGRRPRRGHPSAGRPGMGRAGAGLDADEALVDAVAGATGSAADVEPFAYAALLAAHRWGEDDPRTWRRRAAAALVAARAGDASAPSRAAQVLAGARRTHDGMPVIGALALTSAQCDLAAGDAIAAADHAALAVDVHARWYPPEHPAVLRSRACYARALEASGRAREAAGAWAAVAAVDAGEDGREAARALRRLGRRVPPADAFDGMPQSLAARRAVALAIRDRGDDTEAAFDARWALAEDLVRCGRLEEAEVVFTRAATSFAAGDPSLRLAARNQAAIVREQRLGLEAGRVAFASVLRDARRELGEMAPLTLALHGNLADTLGQLGEADASTWHLGQLVLGLDHIDGSASAHTIAARRRLAMAAFETDQTDPAVEFAARALRDAEASLPPGHELILECRNTQAMAHEMAGESDQARALLERNLVDAESTLAASAPELVAYRTNLAVVYLDAGRVDAAVALLRASAAQLRDEGSGMSRTDPGTLAMAHRSLAEGFARADDAEQARAHWLRAQEAWDRLDPLSPMAWSLAEMRIRSDPGTRLEGGQSDAVARAAAARDGVLALALDGRRREAAILALRFGIDALVPSDPGVEAHYGALASAEGPDALAAGIREAAAELSYADVAVEAAVERLLALPDAASAVEHAALQALHIAEPTPEVAARAVWRLVEGTVRRLRALGRGEAADALLGRYVAALVRQVGADDPRALEPLSVVARRLRRAGEERLAAALGQAVGGAGAPTSGDGS